MKTDNPKDRDFFPTNRRAHWGHWGISFIEYQSRDLYAEPQKIYGTLFFPVGACGPVDGFIGSPERQVYKEICKAWAERGELPANLTP